MKKAIENGPPKESNAGESGDLETLERAIALIESGQLGDAEALLEPLVSRPPYPGAGQLALGGIYLRQERVTEAIDCFSSLVELRPESEGASLGLFHALWMAGEFDDALAEMRRYRAEYESMEYRRLLRDLKARGFPFRPDDLP